MTIEAVIFDFDGTILDTETPEFTVWQAVFAEYGCELPLSVWATAIGGIGLFDPYAFLEQEVGRAIDRTAVQSQVQQQLSARIAQEALRPSVLAYLREAQQIGLRLGVASSSHHGWVDPHLERLGLASFFEVVVCRDDVDNRAKPDPAVYLTAVGSLGILPQHALALEDSVNGLMAAKRAGLKSVAVPNPMTQHMDFSGADYRLSSLDEMPLNQLIKQVLPSG